MDIPSQVAKYDQQLPSLRNQSTAVERTSTVYVSSMPRTCTFTHGGLMPQQEKQLHQPPPPALLSRLVTPLAPAHSLNSSHTS